MKLIVPIGISGSGKSRLYKLKYNDYVKVCPDDIRKELTGDISDQSKNAEVFKLADRRIDDCIRNNKDCFYDATNLNTRFRKSFVNKYKDMDNVEIIYVVLPADVNVSNERIKKDLDNKVERSNVPYTVLLRQYEMYKETLKYNFSGENVQKVIYVKPSDLN